MWIHEHEDWPNFSWDGEALLGLLAEVRHRQGLLLGRMQGMGFELRQEASLSALTSDVVRSSAIEGEVLDRGEVRSSIARRLGLEVGGVVVPSRHVEGVVEMMLDATQRHELPLTEERLWAWQAALFPTGRSGFHQITVGKWRSAAEGPMQVVSGPIGRERVHFEAPAAERIAAEMTAFLAWFAHSPGLDPLLRAGLAHMWFVTIHPFADGNGRIARAIADMALAQSDGTAQRFYSMSTQIEAERRDYYRELERQQRSSPDVTGWLRWFLGCFGRALDSAEGLLAGVLKKSRFWERARQAALNERQQRVLNRMLEEEFQGHLSTSKYAKLAKCSPDTALRDIQELLGWKLLAANPGGGRSSSYRVDWGEG